MKMRLLNMLPGLLSQSQQVLSSTNGSKSAEQSPLKLKLTRIIKESIDDPMVVNLVIPLLTSLSDEELRAYLFKVGRIIEDCLAEVPELNAKQKPKRKS